MVALRSAIGGLACFGLALATLVYSAASAEAERVCELGEKGKGKVAQAESINECIDQLTLWEAEGDALGRVYGHFGATALAADRDHIYRYYSDSDQWIPFVGLKGNRFISSASQSKTPPAKKAEVVAAPTRVSPAEKAEVAATPINAGAHEDARPGLESKDKRALTGPDSASREAPTGLPKSFGGQGAASAGAAVTGKPSSQKNTKTKGGKSPAESKVGVPSGTLAGLPDPAKQQPPSAERTNPSRSGKETGRHQAEASVPGQVAGSGVDTASSPPRAEPASVPSAASAVDAPPLGETAAKSPVPNTEIAARSPETEYFPGSPMCEIRKGGFWERRFAESIGECAVILATAPSSYTVNGVKWGYWDGLFLVSTLEGVYRSEDGETNWTKVSDRP